jgi:hypothetical protein
VAKNLASMGGDAGAAFPGMTMRGGALMGAPALVTDGLAGDELVLVDANQIAAGSGSVEIDSSKHATLQFNSVPDSPPSAATTLESLWQTNRTALKALRYFGCERLRASAVAKIEGADYDDGGSP